MKRIVGILATDLNGTIGKDNSLPWLKCSEDMKHFKSLTEGNTIVMGYNTWESLGSKPLPKRDNVVITNSSEEIKGAQKFPRNFNLRSLAKTSDKAIFIIGGKVLLNAVYDDLTEFYVTVFHKTFEGDTTVNISNYIKGMYLNHRRHILDKNNECIVEFSHYKKA